MPIGSASAAFPGRNGVIAFSWSDPEADAAYLDFTTSVGKPVWQERFVRDGWLPSFSPDGRRLAFAGPAGRFNGIGVTTAPPGRERVLTRPREDDIDRNPSWSPDGRSIVFERYIAVSRQHYFIHSVRSSGSRVKRLVPGRNPAWSVDGTIAYEHSGGGDTDIYAIRPNGSLQRALTTGPAEDSGPDWSPDGRRLVFSRHGDLFTVAAQGGAPRRLTSGRRDDTEPAFSPDGRQIVFTGGSRLRVMPAGGGRARALPCSYTLGCYAATWQPVR